VAVSIAAATALGLAIGGRAIGADAGGASFANKVFDNADPHTSGRGGQVYLQNCAGCHDQGLGHAPQRTMFTFLSPESVERALTSGAMKAQGAGLSAEDKVAVAEFLTGKKKGAAAEFQEPKSCTGAAAKFNFNETPAFAGWGLSPGHTRFIPTKVAGVDKANVGRLKLKWAIAFPNSSQMRSEPTVGGGALFIGSHSGAVYSLDRATGCARWIYHAGSEVRTAIVLSPWKAGDAKARPRVFFGDVTGNAYAVDALTGKLLWRVRAEAHPYATLTGSPTLYNNVLYVPVSGMEGIAGADLNYECCTSRGAVVALDAATGKTIWRTYSLAEPKVVGVNAKGVKMLTPSGANIWNSPTIDARRGQLYVGTGPNSTSPATEHSDSILAMDLKTGRIKWAYQGLKGDASNLGCMMPGKPGCPKEDGPDYDFGAGASLVKLPDGRDIIVAGQKSGEVHAIDPDTGKLIWKVKPGRGGVLGGVQFSLASNGHAVFAPVNDFPNLRHDATLYQEPPQPGVYAYDLATGKAIWAARPEGDTCQGLKDCNPGYSQAITATPDLVFAGANDGWLRVFDASTGAVVWQLDSKKPVPTINGGMGKGGSFSGGAGPILYKGMLFLMSGYNRPTVTAGNVLSVYEVAP
jgi:polyvinyl alcohol dehydrogenase (cytochrome)